MTWLKRPIKYLILIALLTPLIAFVLFYLALQTQTGAGWLSRALSERSGYQIDLGKVNYSLAAPLQLEIEQLRIQNDAQTLADVGRALILINPKFINTPNPIDHLLLENGRLDLNDPSWTDAGLSGNWLLLKNIDIAFTSPLGSAELLGVNAGLSPWKSGRLINPNGAFRLSAQRFTLAGVSGQHLLIEGRSRQGNLIIDSFGANLPNGEITGQAQKNRQGEWIIYNLYLNRFRWQSGKEFQAVFQRLTDRLATFPNLDIRQIDVINANLEGDRWAMNAASLSLRNIQWQNGDWSAKGGQISFSAGDVIFGDWQINDPIVRLTADNRDIVIDQVSARWQGGLVRAHGLWRHNRLDLGEAVISGVEYTLPGNWRSLPEYPFPDWLQTLKVERLNVSRSVVVDVNDEFPFQITWLEMDGQNLRLIDNHRFGLWSGELAAYANNATFNKVDLRYPALTLNADDNRIQFDKMNTFIGSGLVDARLTVGQADKDNFTLNMAAQNVPINFISRWGWETLPISGNGNLKLQFSRQGANTPLNARLEAENQQGQQAIQTIPASVYNDEILPPPGDTNNAVGENGQDDALLTKDADTTSEMRFSPQPNALNL